MAGGGAITPTSRRTIPRPRSRPATGGRRAAPRQGWRPVPGDEQRGSLEAFADPTLYDWEYRRRRADVNFYRMLARERLGYGPPRAALDLACGSGRLLLPLLRDGHRVVGLDHSPAMLAQAARRLARLAPVHRRRAQLLRADLRAFALRPRFGFAVCAFHSLQHLISDADVIKFFQRVRAALVDDGWFAFDVLPARPGWLSSDGRPRFARTVFQHPTTGRKTVYTVSRVFAPRRRALHLRFHYQPIDRQSRPDGPERIVRLCHRQFSPDDIARLLARAGFEIAARFSGFDERWHESRWPLDASSDEHVYLARPAHRRVSARSPSKPG